MIMEIPQSEEEMREQKYRELISLATELGERRECFPFPGINPKALERIRDFDKEYPGYTAPIDDIIARCKVQGIKVVVGTNPKNVGEAYVLPAQSDDIENDRIIPKSLQITEGMDRNLRQLILMDRDRFKFENRD